jgi:2-(1,2-epoxy-1,2-dihydrophenyl)acetyl-CoA isomerase
MEEEPILYEKQDGIVFITLNRPEKLNALTNRMIDDALKGLEKASFDPEVRVVVFRGNGRAFCTGDDLSGMGDYPRPIPPGSTPHTEYQHRLVRTVHFLRRPVIASVHGFCLGMGHDLAMACDLRIAAEGAQFGEPRIRRGMHIATGGTYLLPRLVGLPKALEMLLFGEFVDAQEAQRIGLVHRVVPADRLADATLELARRLAAGPTKAYAVLKAQVYREFDMDLDDAFHDMLHYRFTEHIEDREEGVKAFLEKREPRFTGR